MPPARPLLGEIEKKSSDYKQEHCFIKPCGSLSVKDAADDLINLILGVSKSNDSQIQPNSIYIRLKKFFGASASALDPNPELNDCLSLLVSHLQGNCAVEFKKFSFAHIQQEACFLIDKCHELSSRACDIRQVASRAESSLESYYTNLLLKADDPKIDRSTKLSYVDRIRKAADVFPYIENYVDMVKEEAKLSRCLLSPPLRGRQIIFCGSGPLPLTGFLLAATLECSVTLVDNDQDAVLLSSALIQLWEERNILPPGLVKVRFEDCAMLPLKHECAAASGKASWTEVDRELSCDILFLAALIPNEAKEALATKAASLGRKCPFVAVRSAHGLTARLAYNQNKIETFTKMGLRHWGTMAPRVHDLGNGEIVDGKVKPFSFFPRSILNSLEIYDGRVA